MCVRCALRLRASEVIGDIDGPLRPIYDAIVAAPQPFSAHNWLRSSGASRILAEIGDGSLTLSHAALDSHPKRRSADYLRRLLIANGLLEPRDEALFRLEVWVEDRLSGVEDPNHRQLLGAYGRWRVLRSARRRSERSRTGEMATRYAKCRLQAAIDFLEFLSSVGCDLSSCSQAEVDAWLSSGQPNADQVNEFLDWAAARKLCRGFVVLGRQRRDGAADDPERCWALARRLLRDEDLDLGDRVAGCLVLLYGQQLSRIVALRRDQLFADEDSGATFLHIGTMHIDLPAPLDEMCRQLARDGRRHQGVGSPAASLWLFPGLDPGRPLSAARLGERLRALGLEPAAGRRTALSYLAANLPAAVLGRLLGFSPTTAVRWVHAVGGDWNRYAAELARQQVIADGAE